ncbi:choice-of-anchor U domain-containing protein [Comamonas serinivorans]|nr:choice-of-anchor U domain-containing protein [Comamonas serinivorans]
MLAFLWLMLLSLVMPVDPLHAQEAECAEVKIVIEQKLSLERQAFDAHMVIRNGLDGALTNVSVELFFQDQDQASVQATTDPQGVGATFFYRTDTITGLNSLQGGSLAAKETADIRWLIIPSQGAGGDTASGRMYYIGAKVTYTLNGETTTVDVTPDYVVVRPQPQLVLDYFLPTDVNADDPFTAETEPSEPFTLGVRISNVGMGTSSSTTIESAQPKIVENRQGLLIDFKILSGFVGNEMLGKTLLLNFGDIPGQQAKMGRWLMETTLSGRFVEFNANYSHADSLGGAVTSLIKEVRTHKLVHDVLVDYPGHDDVYDFLAEYGSGYMVYDSAGGSIEAIDRSAQASLNAINANSMRMSFPATQGLVHVKLIDPNRGVKTIARVVRSDGKVLPSQNYWLSKTRNQDLSWSYYVHIFDSNPTGDYVLEFSASSGASLAGLSYLDANGNGIRDAGEAADGNTKITLKGVEDGGKSVLRDGYTDVNCAFSFTGLNAGRYQLTADVRAGWIDGVWQAGSAGGKATPGLITDIVLTGGMNSQGYLLAKRRPDPSTNTDQADLSIAITADRAQLRAGETASVTVIVRNAGEATAKAVMAQVAVPAGLTLVNASTSTGSHGAGVWTLGDMNKGQMATLQISVKADAVSGNQDKGISWPVSVSGTTTDPQSGNNSAMLGLTVLSDNTSELELEQTLPAQARVLMLVSCPSAAMVDVDACETEAVSQAQNHIAPRVTAFVAVQTFGQWQQALRSGEHNVLWLHGGASKLDAQALAELKAAIRRGASLVVDGDIGAQTDAGLLKLADAMGGQHALPAVGQNQAARFVNEPEAQATQGPAYGLSDLASGTQTLASWNSGAAAITRANFGQGKSWSLGFDLLATLQHSAGVSQIFWADHASQQITAITPVVNPSQVLAGTKVAVQTVVRNNAATGSDKDVTLKLSWPSGTSADDVQPAATQTTAQDVNWAWRLAGGSAQTTQVRLLLPSSSGVVSVDTELKEAALLGQSETKQLSLDVVGLDVLVPRVETALASAGADIQAALAAAKTAQQQGDWAQVLAELAKLQAALEASGGTQASLLDVARWMGVAQTQWQGGAVDTPASIVAQSGVGQHTVINTAFAAPLRAKVLDAQGQGMAGVSVLFSLPNTGASAQFADGSTQATALTDAQGVATSPALTANATAGAYQATASTAGVTPSASFALTNNPQGGTGAVPASLRMLSGTGQVAKISTAFVAPLVVQVLDAQGLPVAGVSVRFAFATSGASAQFAGNQQTAQVITDAQGQAQSPSFSANGTVGDHQASASVTGLTGQIRFLLSNTQQAPTLAISRMGGANQAAPINTAYGQVFAVNVVDGQDKPVAGASVVFSLPASGPSASFGGGQVIVAVPTDAGGSAMSPSFVANGQVGQFQAFASVEGAAQPVIFPLQNLPAGGSPGTQFTGTTATGSGTVIANISGGGASCVFNPSATRLMPPDGVWSPLEKFLLPHGLFDFELVGCDVGSEVTITTQWPDLRGITGYLKYGQTAGSGGKPIWYAPNNLRIDLLKHTVTFTIRDGELGDDDLSANGVIRDPGGPVVGGVQAVPGLGTWALSLLAMALVALGLRSRHVRRG